MQPAHHGLEAGLPRVLPGEALRTSSPGQVVGGRAVELRLEGGGVVFFAINQPT